MKLITAEMLAAQAAEKWKEQYFERRGGVWYNGIRTEEIYKKLVALGPLPNPEDVFKVIGNSSWVKKFCDGCGNFKAPVVEVKDEGSNLLILCVDCIRVAFALAHSKPVPHADDCECSNCKPPAT